MFTTDVVVAEKLLDWIEPMSFYWNICINIEFRFIGSFIQRSSFFTFRTL